MPKYLAGREELLDAAELRLKSVAAGYQARSVAYYGLRGVGKTVILNAIESIAENENVLVRHIEVQEKKGFAKALAAASNAFTLNLSSRERMKDKFERLKSVVASFSATWNPEDNTVSFGLDETALRRPLRERATSQMISRSYWLRLGSMPRRRRLPSASA